MSATYTEYYVQLVNKRTKQVIDDDSGIYTVLTTVTPTKATVYSDDKGTSLTIPATMTNGIMQFWTASSVTSVDISGITATGIPFFIKALTPSQHRLEIDTEQYSGMTFILPFDFSATASTSFRDSGFDLQTENVVRDVAVKITTAGANTTDYFTIGTSTDATAFLAACHTKATGLKNKVWVTDLSIAVTGTVPDIQYGANFLVSSTAQESPPAGFKIANSTSGARLKYGDVIGTAFTIAGYVYMELDRVVV